MGSTRYRVVVEGELGPRYASAFEGMDIECHEGTTALVGDVTDQAHLQGILDRISRFGLKLVSVTPADDE